VRGRAEDLQFVVEAMKGLAAELGLLHGGSRVE